MNVPNDLQRAYGVGLAGLILASTLKFALTSVFETTFTGLLFAPVILVAAGLGGLAPGIVVTAFSVPLVYALSLQPVGAADVLLFAVVGGGIAWLGGSMRKARNRTLATTELLQRRESYLQSILDSVSDATIAIRPDGEIVSFNAAAERLFGYREAEVLHRNLRLLMTDPQATDEDGLFEPALRTAGRNPRLLNGRHRDGTAFAMSIEMVEASTEDEPLFTCFARDLSESQRAASRLEQAQAELARLSRLNEMGEMASTLAHEINQPLSAVANYVQGCRRMLERFEPSMLGEMHESLSAAAAQALRAGGIIHHLREFMARGETDKEIVDVAALVNSGAALALVGTREAAVSTRIELSQSPALVLADTIQIQQVLVNLLRNAIDAVRSEPVREITIQSHVGATDVRIEVHDTGAGIAPELEQRIFQPFVTSKSQGMGIGLSISKRIIESHGGSIRARRRLSGGTTLSFTLPLVNSEAYADDQ